MGKHRNFTENSRKHSRLNHDFIVLYLLLLFVWKCKQRHGTICQIPVSAQKDAYMTADHTWIADDSCTKMEFAGVCVCVCACVEQQGESNILLRMYLISLFWKRKRGTVIGLAGSLAGRIH